MRHFLHPLRRLWRAGQWRFRYELAFWGWKVRTALTGVHIFRVQGVPLTLVSYGAVTEELGFAVKPHHAVLLTATPKSAGATV